MNIKILGLFGVLALCTVPCAVHAVDEIEEIEEFDFDSDFDDVFLDDFDDEEFEFEIEDEEPSDEVAQEEVAAPATVETRTVKSRETCDDINKRVNELRADIAAHPEYQAELDNLILRQRACAPRANRRPVRNYNNINPVKTVEIAPAEEVAPVEEVVSETEIIATEVKEIEKTPEEIAATAAENHAQGLCDDGTKPNQYGCCANERFKQVSTMVFACCPKEGDGECHEPLAKK